MTEGGEAPRVVPKGVESAPPNTPDRRAAAAASPKRRTIRAPLTGKRVTGIPAQTDPPAIEQDPQRQIGALLRAWRLSEGEGFTMKMLGEQLGISGERWRQYEANGIPKDRLREISEIVKRLGSTGNVVPLRDAIEALLNDEQGNGETVVSRERSSDVNSVVPFDLKEAGKKLREACTKHGVTSAEIASVITIDGQSVDQWYIEDFMDGINPHPNLAKIIEATKEYIEPDYANPEDPVVKMEEILKKREEEEKWLRTLTQTSMTLQKSMLYLRLSTGLTQKGFAAEAKTTRSSIEEYENGRHIPSGFNLENILKAASFDPERKPAQFLRLQVADQSILSVNDLQNCTFGDLMNYLRILKGSTQKSLGERLGYLGSTLSLARRNDFSIREGSANEFISWLDLNPDGALAKVIRLKYSKKSIPPGLLEEVLGEQYLFKEHLNEYLTVLPNLSVEAFLSNLQQQDSLANKLQVLIQRRDEDEDTIAKFWTSKKQFGLFKWRLIQGKTTRVFDYNLMRFLMVYGYDIHHPVTQYLLNSLTPLEEATSPASDGFDQE